MCSKLISFFPQPLPRGHTWIYPKTNIMFSSHPISLLSVKVTTIRLGHEKHVDSFGHLLRICKIPAGSINFTSKMHSKSIHSPQFNPSHQHSSLQENFIRSLYFLQHQIHFLHGNYSVARLVGHIPVRGKVSQFNSQVVGSCKRQLVNVFLSLKFDLKKSLFLKRNVASKNFQYFAIIINIIYYDISALYLLSFLSFF